MKDGRDYSSWRWTRRETEPRGGLGQKCERMMTVVSVAYREELDWGDDHKRVWLISEQGGRG